MRQDLTYADGNRFPGTDLTRKILEHHRDKIGHDLAQLVAINDAPHLAVKQDLSGAREVRYICILSSREIAALVARSASPRTHSPP